MTSFFLDTYAKNIFSVNLTFSAQVSLSQGLMSSCMKISSAQLSFQPLYPREKWGLRCLRTKLIVECG